MYDCYIEYCAECFDKGSNCRLCNQSPEANYYNSYYSSYYSDYFSYYYAQYYSSAFANMTSNGEEWDVQKG